MALKTSTAVFQTVAVGGQSNVVVDSASDVLTLTGSSPILITTDASTDTVTFAHAATDGNLHVPATSTTNSGKVLTAGATAGSLSWQTPTGGGGNAFGIVAVSGQSNVEADAANDTLTLIAGSNVTITTNATNDSVTIASTDTNTTYTAGNGLGLSGTAFSLDTPGTITGATTNAVTADSHTHAVSLTAANVSALSTSGGTVTGNTSIIGTAGSTYNTTSPATLALGNTTNRGYLQLNGITSGAYSVIQTTTGNLHIDPPPTSGTIYMNWYAGTGHTYFGNGAGGAVQAIMDNNGQLWKGDKASVYWHSGNVGSGNGLTLSGTTITMGTPSTLTTATANETTTTSHTHAVTFPVTSVNTLTGAVTLTASNVGAATVRTISTSAPSGGVSGDVWYVV